MQNPAGSLLQTFLSIFLLFILILPCMAAEEMDWSKPILMGRPPLPEIPKVLTRSNQMGVVILKTEVAANGTVKGNEIIKSTASKHVDNYLKDWINEWQFIPRLCNGEVKNGFTVITIRFDLSKMAFDAPMPNNAPLQIPYAIAKALATSNVPEATRNPDDTVNVTNKSSKMKSSEL